MKTRKRRRNRRGGKNIPPNYEPPLLSPPVPLPVRIRIQDLDDEQLAQLIAAVNAELERREQQP